MPFSFWSSSAEAVLMSMSSALVEGALVSFFVGLAFVACANAAGVPTGPRQSMAAITSVISRSMGSSGSKWSRKFEDQPACWPRVTETGRMGGAEMTRRAGSCSRSFRHTSGRPCPNLSCRGRNDGEALGEVGRIAEAIRGDAAMFTVVQLHILTHGLEELLGQRRIAHAEVPYLRREASDHILCDLALVGLADPALLGDLLHHAGAP